MRKILLAVVALSLLAGSTAQAFPFKKKKKKAKTEQTATPPAPKESAFDKQVMTVGFYLHKKSFKASKKEALALTYLLSSLKKSTKFCFCSFIYNALSSSEASSKLSASSSIKALKITANLLRSLDSSIQSQELTMTLSTSSKDVHLTS